MAFAAQAEESVVLTSPAQKVSYGFGLDLGNRLKNQGLDIDFELLKQGLLDAVSGSETVLTEDQAKAVLQKAASDLREQTRKHREAMAETNRASGEAYRKEHAAKPGVITLPSGLQYEVLREGSGESPAARDKVTVNYEGRLIDGTVFDSSYEREKPATFSVNGVIKGWSEALPLMKVGSKWQLVIPPDLAYGEAGSGTQIGPQSTLVFDIELLGVTAAPPPQPVTSDIIKVPSAEELKKGAKIEVIKKEDLERLTREAEKAKSASENEPEQE